MLDRRRSARRGRSLPVLLTAAALATALLSGCAGLGALAPPSPTSTSAAPSRAPMPTPDPATSSSSDPGRAAAVATDGWLEYVSTDGTASFRYPPSWTLDAQSERFAPDADRDDVQDPYVRWFDSATLTAPNGQQLLAMHDFVDVGGSCDAPVPLEVLSTEPAAARPLDEEDEAIIATVALRAGEGHWKMGIGVTGAAWIDGDEACTVYFIGGSSEGGVGFGTHFQMSLGERDPLWSVDSLDDARAYMETDEYATIIEILRSYRTR